MRSSHARRINPLPAALAVLAMLLSACASQAATDSDGDGKTEIRYQSYAGSVDILQLADALDYLPNIELVKQGDVTGGPQALQALVSNQVDIAASAFFGATAQLVATGAPIKAVVSSYGSKGDITSSVVVAEDSTIKTAKDLIGKKIAVNTLGANAEAVLDTWFDAEGLTKEETDQITLVALPPLNTEAALRGGKIDAAYMSSGFLTIAKKQGGIKEIFKDVDLIGPYNGGGLTMADKFLDQNPDVATELATGVAKAVQFIETHERQETLDVYVPWLEEHGYGDYVEAVETNWPGSTGVASDTAEIKEKDISIWLDWLESRGDVDAGSIEPSDVYTNEFNELVK